MTLLAGRPIGRDAVVVDHAVAAAYCLPGRCRRIVVTSAAFTALRDDELDAVLAHERAHLGGRHHLLLTSAQGLHRAFPGAPIFRDAHEQIGRLVEMLADDIASDQHGRHTVAAAMAAVVGGSAPDAALAAGGSGALGRARRLIGPVRPLPTRNIVAGFALAAAGAVLPVVLAASPALAATRTPPCMRTYGPTASALPVAQPTTHSPQSCHDRLGAGGHGVVCACVLAGMATGKSDSIPGVNLAVR